MRLEIFIIPFILSGCTSLIWVGKNSKIDIEECNIETANQYPPILYSEQSGGGYQTPIKTTCNSNKNSTSCTTTGGTYIPPSMVTRDANKAIRNDAFRYCMERRGNRLISTSDYQKYINEPPAEETPTQRKIRIREECRSVNGQHSPLCSDQKPMNRATNNETPAQRKIRLREECRSMYGQDSQLCIDKSVSEKSTDEITKNKRNSEREACIRTRGKYMCTEKSIKNQDNSAEKNYLIRNPILDEESGSHQ